MGPLSCVCACLSMLKSVECGKARAVSLEPLPESQLARATFSWERFGTTVLLWHVPSWRPRIRDREPRQPTAQPPASVLDTQGPPARRVAVRRGARALLVRAVLSETSAQGVSVRASQEHEARFFLFNFVIS